MAVPLLNTLLLVSSGATVTYGHHAMFRSDRGAALLGLLLTVVLAAVFTALQGLEYDVAGFSIADGAYGSCFFFATGFHGFHVLVGTIALAVGLARLFYYHFTSTHHIGLEASILYWHTSVPYLLRLLRVPLYAIRTVQGLAWSTAACVVYRDLAQSTQCNAALATRLHLGFVDVVWLFLYLAVYWWGAA